MRLGLVGYGFGARCFHAPFIDSAPDVELAGVVARSVARRDQLGRERPGTPVYGSLAEMAAAGVDAVAISTPVDTHVELVTEAVGLGLPVVCDKPFAPDAASARLAVDAAARAGVLLCVFQNRRWDSDFLTARKVLAGGHLGDVTRFESRFELYAPDQGFGASGGGMLRDIGSHLVDQAVLLFGAVDAVYAELNDLDGRDDDMFVALRHEQGVISHLWGSARQPSPGPRLRVTGQRAAYVAPAADAQGHAVMAGRSPATEGDAWGVEAEDTWGWIDDGAGRRQVPTERGRWDAFYPAFAAAVRGDAPPPVDPRDAVAVLDILDAARVAAGKGRVVDPAGA